MSLVNTLRNRECFSLPKTSVPVNESRIIKNSPAEKGFDGLKSRLMEEFNNRKKVFFTEANKNNRNLMRQIPLYITINGTFIRAHYVFKR